MNFKTLATVALGGSLLLGACTSTSPQDAARTYGKGAAAAADPWKVGCQAVNLGVQAKGVQRQVQVKVLQTILKRSNLNASQRTWVNNGVKLLSYSDPRKAPKKLRNTVSLACSRRALPMPALR